MYNMYAHNMLKADDAKEENKKIPYDTLHDTPGGNETLKFLPKNKDTPSILTI